MGSNPRGPSLPVQVGQASPILRLGVLVCKTLRVPSKSACWPCHGLWVFGHQARPPFSLQSGAALPPTPSPVPLGPAHCTAFPCQACPPLQLSSFPLSGTPFWTLCMWPTFAHPLRFITILQAYTDSPSGSTYRVLYTPPPHPHLFFHKGIEAVRHCQSLHPPCSLLILP